MAFTCFEYISYPVLSMQIIQYLKLISLKHRRYILNPAIPHLTDLLMERIYQPLGVKEIPHFPTPNVSREITRLTLNGVSEIRVSRKSFTAV